MEINLKIYKYISIDNNNMKIISNKNVIIFNNIYKNDTNDYYFFVTDFVPYEYIR